MFSDMQYTQRKSHRSVTETRRYEIPRPNGSTKGAVPPGEESLADGSAPRGVEGKVVG
jgi:hypothetical protein